jgi:hypothetical protein
LIPREAFPLFITKAKRAFMDSIAFFYTLLLSPFLTVFLTATIFEEKEQGNFRIFLKPPLNNLFLYQNSIAYDERHSHLTKAIKYFQIKNAFKQNADP